MQANITLPPDAITAVVSKAILDTLDETTKQTLVREAIAHLLTTDDRNYDRSSPLQRAFRQGVDEVARKLLKEKMEADVPFMDKLRQTIADAVEKAFDETNRSKLIATMADAITKAI